MSDIASKLIDFVEAEELAYGQPELCGIVTADGDVAQLPNIHADPLRGFHIEPAAFLDALKAGAVATWHTHPGKDPNLSEEDMAGFRQWPQLVHHILGIRDGEPHVHSFRVVDGAVVTA